VNAARSPVPAFKVSWLPPIDEEGPPTREPYIVTILIVDDSKAMRMIVLRTLRQAGYDSHEIAQAEHGRDALNQLAAGLSPDLILCDWNMPEVNGIELLRQLRADGSTVPFGFVTSESTPAMREQATEAGAAFLIGKPFTPDTFSDTLKPVLG
jgi:two-component system chemotaxis response regulator CheY